MTAAGASDEGSGSDGSVGELFSSVETGESVLTACRLSSVAEEEEEESVLLLESDT